MEELSYEKLCDRMSWYESMELAKVNNMDSIDNHLCIGNFVDDYLILKGSSEEDLFNGMIDKLTSMEYASYNPNITSNTKVNYSFKNEVFTISTDNKSFNCFMFEVAPNHRTLRNSKDYAFFLKDGFYMKGVFGNDFDKNGASFDRIEYVFLGNNLCSSLERFNSIQKNRKCL